MDTGTVQSSENSRELIGKEFIKKFEKLLIY
jgi:hypothetical protein